MVIPRNKLFIIVCLLALTASLALLVAWPDNADGPDERPPLGLLTTLPIYWPETNEIGELLRSDDQIHWARMALEKDYDLMPLNTLDDGGGLEDLRLLLLAQPRALSPEENVALDEWVRSGGRVLLFADPFLTGESNYHIGDRRRPQDVIMLSPILARWGLELTFAEDQRGDLRNVVVDRVALPVRLAGAFSIRPTTDGANASCQLLGDAVIADCAIGEGQALIIADAALFEDDGGAVALDGLTRLAFESG